MIEELENWFALYPILTNVLKYLVWIGLVFIIVAWIRHLLKKILPNHAVKYKAQKGVQIVGYVFVIFMTFTYFTGSIKDFGLTIGLLTAGIAITLQELILSIAGFFYVFFAKVYKPGDRIEINGIKGDVIDIGSVYTTMMEIGEWVSSDNYTGRIVKLSNAFVFKGPVYNYSQDFPFVWDELNLPIRHGSDLELAKSIVISVAQEVLVEYVRESMIDWKKVVNKYYIEDAQVEPTLAITMNNKSIQFNLRYIVDYKRRRLTKHKLNEEIGKKIIESNGKVLLATSTLEIIKIPTIKLKDESSNQNSN